MIFWQSLSPRPPYGFTPFTVSSKAGWLSYDRNFDKASDAVKNAQCLLTPVLAGRAIRFIMTRTQNKRIKKSYSAKLYCHCFKIQFAFYLRHTELNNLLSSLFLLCGGEGRIKDGVLSGTYSVRIQSGVPLKQFRWQKHTVGEFGVPNCHLRYVLNNKSGTNARF